MKAHWPADPAAPAPRRTLCGDFAPPVPVAPVREGVTCKICARLMPEADPAERYAAEVFTPRPVTEYARRTEDAALEPLIDPELELPILTRRTWRRLRCACGSCEVCRWFGAIYRDQYADPWRRPSSATPGPRRWRWGSVRQALEWFADQIEDGIGAPSTMGWAAALGQVRPDPGEDLELHAARCLAMLARSSSPSSGGRAAEDAEDRVAVAQALLRAYHEEQEPGVATSIQVLFRRQVGRRRLEKAPNGSTVVARVPVPAEDLAAELGLTRGQIRAIVRRGRTVVQFELGRRDLIPPPKKGGINGGLVSDGRGGRSGGPIARVGAPGMREPGRGIPPRSVCAPVEDPLRGPPRL